MDLIFCSSDVHVPAFQGGKTVILLSGMCFGCRLESSFRSFSRPVLHAAARVVQEMGRSRAAAFSLGLQDIDEGAFVNTFSEAADSQDSDANENSQPESNCLFVHTFYYISVFYLFLIKENSIKKICQLTQSC